MRETLDRRSVRDDRRGNEAEQHQGEIFGGAETQRDLHDQWREQRHDDDADAAADEGADGRHEERDAGAALPCHRIAVDAR